MINIREDITILFLLWGKIIIMCQKMAEDFVLNLKPEKKYDDHGRK